MQGEVIVHIRPWYVAAALAFVTVVLAAINYAFFSLLGVEGVQSRASLLMLDVTREGNIPTMFSAAVLMCASFAAMTNAADASLLGLPPWLPGWRALAAIFLFLAVDEAAQIHEQVSRFIKVGAEGDLAFLDLYSWVFLYAPATVLLGMAFMPFLRALPRRTAALLILSGVFYVFGAVGLELIGAWQQVSYGLARDSLAVVLRSVAEETTETLGVVLFVGAVLEHAARMRNAITFRVGVGRSELQEPPTPSLQDEAEVLLRYADTVISPRAIRAMTDSDDPPRRRGRGDRSRIDVGDQWELEYWSRKWGVSRDRIKKAVLKVGPKTDDVAAELGDALFYSDVMDPTASPR